MYSVINSSDTCSPGLEHEIHSVYSIINSTGTCNTGLAYWWGREGVSAAGWEGDIQYIVINKYTQLHKLLE